MTFDVNYTPDYLRDARRVMLPLPWDWFRPPRGVRSAVRWSVAVGAVAVLIGLPVLTSRRQIAAAPPPGQPSGDLIGPLGIALLPWAIGLAFLAPFWYGRRRKVAAAAAESAARVHRFEVDAAGVTVTDGPTRTARRWPAFDRFVETDRLLMLRVVGQRRTWLMAPKRAIVDPAELDAVRRLFVAAAAPPTPGFPVSPARVNSAADRV